MSRTIFLLTVSAAVVLSLPACAQVPDYSPNYVQVPVYSQRHPERVVGYQLAPESCLTPDPTDDQLGSRLPPGCANDANLEAMVERKSDLVRGRKLGPAPASPTARAAQKYIYGTSSFVGGGVAGTGLASSGSVSTNTLPASPAPSFSPAPSPSPATSPSSVSASSR